MVAAMQVEMLRPRIQEDRIAYFRDVREGDLDDLLPDLADEIGLPLLGYGSARMVFALSDDKVLKVALTRYGMQANRRELFAATRLPQNLVAQVYEGDADGLWLVQERVQILDDASKDLRPRMWAISNDIREIIPQAQSDVHYGNFGYRRDGSLVMVDLESVSPIEEVLRPGEQEIDRFLMCDVS